MHHEAIDDTAGEQVHERIVVIATANQDRDDCWFVGAQDADDVLEFTAHDRFVGYQDRTAIGRGEFFGVLEIGGPKNAVERRCSGADEVAEI